MKVPSHKKSEDKNAFPESVCFAGNFDGQIMHAIHQLHSIVEKRLDQVLRKQNDLSFSQCMILVGFSCKNQEVIIQAKLAEQLLLTEATVSRHIRALVAKKYLTKEKKIDNKKSYNITLSKEGFQAFASAKKIITEELHEYFSHITDSDKKNIIKNCLQSVYLIQEKK